MSIFEGIREGSEAANIVYRDEYMDLKINMGMRRFISK